MLTNVRKISVQWGDCDPAGIVFFPRYFEWCNACTAALFVAAGISSHALHDAWGIAGIPMVDTRAKFFIPSTFEKELTVESELLEFRKSSFVIRHRMRKNGDLAVECVETRVWAVRDPDNPKKLRSHPVPAEVIALYTGA